VINSHYHNDHIWGNQAFDPQVEIISSARTRELIITEGALEIKWYRETAQKQLDDLLSRYEEAGEANLRRNIKPMICVHQAILAALPILQVRLPSLTFTGEMSIYGPKRSVRLMPYENAHCGHDAILYLPGDGIVFMETSYSSTAIHTWPTATRT
jgi:cyclase